MRIRVMLELDVEEIKKDLAFDIQDALDDFFTEDVNVAAIHILEN